MANTFKNVEKHIPEGVGKHGLAVFQKTVDERIHLKALRRIYEDNARQAYGFVPTNNTQVTLNPSFR